MIKEAFAWVFYQEDLENLKGGDKKTKKKHPKISQMYTYT
jgi:hypothetical protein